jgi:hypothetical protein
MRLLADHATSDTFGAMVNAPIVAGYASGQSPAESVLGATLASYSLSGSVGAKLNAIGGDPWLTSVSSGYLSTQAGGVLNSIGGRVDGPVSGVPALLMASSVYSGTTYLQAIRAIANAAAGDVVRVGTTRQFNVFPIGDTGHLSPRRWWRRRPTIRISSGRSIACRSDRSRRKIVSVARRRRARGVA